MHRSIFARPSATRSGAFCARSRAKATYWFPHSTELELAGRAPDLPSLAVMPFLSIGEDCGPLTLGSGVASEIINELARNRDLRLIGRDSSFALANQNLMAQELGEQLGARYLVEGTAQRLDGTLVVDVQLVDARDGSIAWGDRFSGQCTECSTGAARDREQDRRKSALRHTGSGETRHSGSAPARPRRLRADPARHRPQASVQWRGNARRTSRS